uniref:multinuclear nonheme iron-dependent oxidase n=1 Tax=Dyadobacter sp. TaxID=1914288 RepID=UPI003F71F370
MPQIFSTIACNLDAHILQASIPLFEMEKVEAIEWSFDALFKVNVIPEWFTDFIKEFSDQNRLIGHGVYFSLFSGKWSAEQQNWLDQLGRLCGQFQFDHITEHFGFMTGDDFHKGAPLGIPFNASTLAIGKDRLARIQNACNCPVGLENLAFSYLLDEVKRHGEFLGQLVESVNGFIILDLHNLYCQCHNFDLDFGDFLSF